MRRPRSIALWPQTGSVNGPVSSKARSEELRALGVRIEAAMSRAGLSRAELARACGVSWQTVNFWVQGERAISLDNARAVAHATGVPLQSILDLSENPPYSAWQEFLSAPQSRSATEVELAQLRGLVFPPEQEPTLATYLMALAMFRSVTHRPTSE